MNKAKEGLYYSIEISLETINILAGEIQELCQENYYQKSRIEGLAIEIDQVRYELQETVERLKIYELDVIELTKKKYILQERINFSNKILYNFSPSDIEYEVEKEVVDLLNNELENIKIILEKIS